MKGDSRRELGRRPCQLCVRHKVKQQSARTGEAVGSLSRDWAILRILPLCRMQVDRATSAATSRQIADVHASDKQILSGWIMLSLSLTPTVSVWGEPCENILHTKCSLNNIINRCFRARPARRRQRPAVCFISLREIHRRSFSASVG